MFSYPLYGNCAANPRKTRNCFSPLTLTQEPSAGIGVRGVRLWDGMATSGPPGDPAPKEDGADTAVAPRRSEPPKGTPADRRPGVPVATCPPTTPG